MVSLQRLYFPTKSRVCFTQQINELDENAYMYSAGCEQADIDACVASSPTERTLFYPKPVVRKILLQLHHGEEITAVFTIRSQVDPQVAVNCIK